VAEVISVGRILCSYIKKIHDSFSNQNDRFAQKKLYCKKNKQMKNFSSQFEKKTTKKQLLKQPPF
jgi:UDP-N-acetylglucosamine:LPS N-acetylglucosamine transferase